MRSLVLNLAALCLVAVAAAARADEQPIFVHEIPDAKTYARYAKVVEADELGKFLIDLQSDQILFFDVNLFALHRDFVFKAVLHREMTPEEIHEYNRNYHADKPRFILGYLAHHLKTDTWDFSFWEGDKIRPDQIRQVRARLAKTFFVKELPWRPESTMQEALLPELRDMPTVTNDKLYKDVPYQAFNRGTAVGKLRIVPAGTPYESLTFARDEIVVLQESYPDLPPVAGILSTTFATPLSHVNLRARTWNVPNAGYKRAATDYAALDGKIVYLEVRDVDHTLRAATAAEIAAADAAHQAARKVRVPRANLEVTELRPLATMRAADASIYGAKAANLGEIVHAKIATVNVPDGFGIPFSAYRDHMRRNHLDAEVDAFLKDPRFPTDAAWRKQASEKLRARIAAAPIDPKLLDAVAARVDGDLKGAGVFVRSSTNAEDLEGFNGAGLYDTVPNVKGKAQLADAIRTVWASLWSFHAIEERELFGIDEHTVFAGVFVQVGIDATAAGVLVTRDLYDPTDDHSYTINAKRGLGLRVVGGTTIPEQVIYDIRFPGAKVISRSDDATQLVFDAAGGLKEIPAKRGEPVLTEAHARDLSRAVKTIVPLFSAAYPLDVEWVLQGEKIWIVQARPFMER
jgi:hypothetical protein